MDMDGPVGQTVVRLWISNAQFKLH